MIQLKKKKSAIQNEYTTIQDFMNTKNEYVCNNLNDCIGYKSLRIC